MPPKTIQFIEFEEAASIIRSFEPLVVPGLLQTKEYADTLLHRLAPSDMPQDAIDTRVEVRIRRQRILEQTEPILFFILDESILLRLAGDKEIMQGQIAHLISIASNSNVTVEIIPLSVGIYASLIEPFTILEFPNASDSDVLYLEGSRDAVVSQDEAGQIGTYRETFEQLRNISLGPEGSMAYLASLVKR